MTVTSNEYDEIPESAKLEKKLVILSNHQDQQTTFLNIMEGIRWKFVTAFGVGAGIALFFTTKEVTPEQKFIACCIVVIISLSGLITLIRIYGLVHAAWHRIECLQREEANIVQQLYGFRDSLKPAFEFPHANWRGRSIFSVHMATDLPPRTVPVVMLQFLSGYQYPCLPAVA